MNIGPDPWKPKLPHSPMQFFIELGIIWAIVMGLYGLHRDSPWLAGLLLAFLVWAFFVTVLLHWNGMRQRIILLEGRWEKQEIEARMREARGE